MRPGGSGPAVTLRPATAGDREFLQAVFASTRVEELASVPWDGPTKAAFLAQQFDAQDRWWHQQNPGADFCVVVVDGQDAGRSYVDRGTEQIRVVDLALLPAFRSRGIGTALLSQLVAESEAAGLPVTLHVERHNRARRLYERLGFELAAEAGIYLLLRREPRGARPAGQA